MGLYVDISQPPPDAEISVSPDITRSLVAELPYHRITATIRYDPSYPYPDIGDPPRNVTVGFIQNIVDIDTWVQFDGRRLIRQDYGRHAPMLDSDIPDTRRATDLAWYSNGTMQNGNRAFATFRYGRSMTAPTTTTRPAGYGFPLALPGGSGSGSSGWTLATISMDDYPQYSYYTNFRGASSGNPLQIAQRQLIFRIWVCMLIEGDSPSVAANYYILARRPDLVSGHRVSMSGGGRLSGTDGRYDVIPWPNYRPQNFTVFHSTPGRGVGHPIVTGTRAPDYNDGLYARGASPDHIGL